MFLEDAIDPRRCVLEGLEARPRGCRGQRPRSGGRGQAPPRRSPAPAHPVLPHLPGTTGGRDGRSRADGWTPTRTPPGQPSKMDTLLGLLDGASGHQGGRPPRPTAWPDAFLWSSAVVHPCGWPGSTNDERLSPPWAAVRPSIRVGVQPSRSGASIPTAMVRVMVKRLARQSPSRPASVQPGRMTLFAQVLRALNSGP
jgi:hypothetical protein